MEHLLNNQFLEIAKKHALQENPNFVADNELEIFSESFLFSEIFLSEYYTEIKSIVDRLEKVERNQKENILFNRLKTKLNKEFWYLQDSTIDFDII